MGRDIAKTLELVAEIEAAEIEVWSYSDARRISVEEELDEMNATLKGIVDKAESRRASIRTSAGLAAKAQKGHVTGTVAFGYTRVPTGDHAEYAINEAEANVVRRIFALAVEGNGGRRIANILNADNVPAPGKLRKNAKGETLRSPLWSKFTIKAILRRRLYNGELVFGATRSKGKRQGKRVKGGKVTVTAVPDLRIVSPELWAAVQAHREKNKAAFIRQSNGRLLSKPENGVVAKRLLNTIARCWQCGAGLIYWNKSGKREAKYYCSSRMYKGNAGCSNGAGIPAEALDLAVNMKLYDMLNKDFDTTVSLCMEQVEVWRAQRASTVSAREADEREVARLEGIISKLTDAIEQGQPVGDRLKARQQELDTLRSKLEAAEIVPTRRDFEAMLAPLGPIVGLGMENVATTRSILHKLGLSRIAVEPDGPDGWKFTGPAHMLPLAVHRRVKAAPPDTPHRIPAWARTSIVAPAEPALERRLM